MRDAFSQVPMKIIRPGSTQGHGWCFNIGEDGGQSLYLHTLQGICLCVIQFDPYYPYHPGYYPHFIGEESGAK